MSVADLTARIDAARGDRQRASDLLAEARGMSEPKLEPPQEGLLDILSGVGQDDFDWDDGRDVGGLIGEFVGGAVGCSLGARGGAALGGAIGSLLGPVGTVVGAVVGGITLGLVGDEVGSEVGSAVGGEIGEEIEDLVEGRGFGTGDEDSEGGVPAPRPGDPEPADGVRVPGLDSAYYGSSPPGQGNAADTAYDERVTGSRPGLGVYLENPTAPSGKTEFDWIEYAPNGEITLLDAKNAGENSIYNSEFGREIRAVPQAQRQITAIEHSGIDSEDIQIEWRVASEETAQALQETFRDHSIDITVEYVP